MSGVRSSSIISICPTCLERDISVFDVCKVSNHTFPRRLPVTAFRSLNGCFQGNRHPRNTSACTSGTGSVIHSRKASSTSRLQRSKTLKSVLRQRTRRYLAVGSILCLASVIYTYFLTRLFTVRPDTVAPRQTRALTDRVTIQPHPYYTTPTAPWQTRCCTGHPTQQNGLVQTS